MLYSFFTADRKIVLFHMEHSPINPLPRGAPTICLDADTGEAEWILNMRGNRWGGHNVLADGIIGFFNSYDNRIYAIGKGPTETTVNASPKVSVHGTSVILEGNVMDISAGTKDSTISPRFPAGVPAVADESMSEWMQYVYMQFEHPGNVMGVTVNLEAVDPNNNYQNLGTTTTDSSGNYGFTFEPEVPGQYLIMATFEGTKSYWSSTQTTYLTVDQAMSPSTTIEPEEPETPVEPEDPETPTEPEEPETPTEPEQPAETPLITTEVAIIAAVAIAAVIGVAAFWALRKRG